MTPLTNATQVPASRSPCGAVPVMKRDRRVDQETVGVTEGEESDPAEPAIISQAHVCSCILTGASPAVGVGDEIMVGVLDGSPRADVSVRRRSAVLSDALGRSQP